jgi:hypothetical protein
VAASFNLGEPDLYIEEKNNGVSLESAVDDPLATMNSFNRQFGVNNDEKEALAWAWPYEIGNTMFHVVNAYTLGQHRWKDCQRKAHTGCRRWAGIY